MRHWVKPRLAAEVRFVEWTAEGRLLHSVFLGLRTDKRAQDIHREE
jgi:bifunctional non-homologous end joining protein LigD